MRRVKCTQAQKVASTWPATRCYLITTCRNLSYLIAASCNLS
jgi:hypothetical protein